VAVAIVRGTRSRAGSRGGRENREKVSEKQAENEHLSFSFLKVARILLASPLNAHVSKKRGQKNFDPKTGMKAPTLKPRGVWLRFLLKQAN
jgi:hypothetical protein